MVRLGDTGIIDLRIGDTGAKRAYLGDVQVWPGYHRLQFWTEEQPIADMDSWMDGATASGLYCVSEDVSDFWASLKYYPDMTSVYDATGDRTFPVIAVNGGSDVSVLASRDGAVGTCYVNTDITSAQVVYEGEGSQRQAVGYAYIGAFVWSDDGTTRDIAWCWIVDTDVEIQDTATFTYGSETHTVSRGGIYLPRATVGFSGEENELVTREYGVEEYTPIVTASYLTFSSPGAFTLRTNNGGQNWDGTLYYSVDGATWSVWDGTSTLASGAAEGVQQLLLRGTGNTHVSWLPGGGASKNWVLDGTDISCSGNIETLLDWETVRAGGHPEMGARCFFSLFSGNGNLISAPALPSPVVTVGCYDAMFRNTGVTVPPALPALELQNSCYLRMFQNTPIRLSETQTGAYTTPYRIPETGTGTETGSDSALIGMFTNTAGTFTGTPVINTTYYLAAD